MTKPLVNINLVVYNGERYLRQCLDSIKQQTYQNIEVTILDNNSIDATRQIIEQEYPQYQLIAHGTNLGMWPGQEVALESSHGEYIVAISVDIILEPDFIERALEIFESDREIGALQAKIYQYNLADLQAGKLLEKKIIDTCGFEIFRSRRLINIGHGQHDRGEYDTQCEIFGVEGAVPMFRRTALESIRIQGHFADPEFFWYGDDFDFAWRMNLFGWRQTYSPRVIAYHDRQTTKSLRKYPWEFIGIRRQIPMKKRRLDFRNKLFTFIKNDYVINILRDLPAIFMREAPLWGYYLVFEPIIFLELVTVVKKAKNMLKKRKEVMVKATRTPAQIHRWFH